MYSEENPVAKKPKNLYLEFSEIPEREVDAIRNPSLDTLSMDCKVFKRIPLEKLSSGVLGSSLKILELKRMDVSGFTDILVKFPNPEGLGLDECKLEEMGRHHTNFLDMSSFTRMRKLAILGLQPGKGELSMGLPR